MQMAVVLADLIVILIMFVYTFYVLAFVLYQTYKKARYEFFRHRTWFLVSSFVLLLTVPLDVQQMLLWKDSF